MNAEIKRLTRAVSVMAVLGWLADACARVSLHQGWTAVLAAFNTVMSVGLAIALHQALKRA